MLSDTNVPPCEGTMKIAAIDLAAKQRGTSYGKLSSRLSQEEAQRIYDKYEQGRYKKRKKKE